MSKRPTYKDLEQRIQLLEEAAKDARRVQDALRESEERFRDLFNNAGEGGYYTTPEGRLADANMAFARMLGYESPQEAVDNITDIASQLYADPDDRRKILDLLTEKEHLNNFECRMRRRDGTIFWALINARLAYLQEGTPCIEGFVADITQRKQTEETLKESEEKYRSLLDNAVDGIIIADFDGVFLEVNRKVEELLGFARDELLGMRFTDIHPKEEIEKVMCAFHAMTEGKRYLCSDTRVLRKDGTSIPVDITGAPIEYAGKRIMQGIFRDITERKHAEDELHKVYDELELRVQERTFQLSEAYESLQREMDERKRAEEQLRQSQKMKAIGTLAGGIAHDFNNILAGIMGFAEMVRDDIDPDSPEYYRLGLVLKGAHRGRDLVRQILTFSRQSEHEQKPAALSDIVDESLKLLRPLLPATAQIRSKGLTGDDTILADPAQMHQVLINLCTNGVQAMGKKGGVLEISVTREHFRKDGHVPVPGVKAGDYVILKVHDTGCGMKPEIMERIFDPFFTTKSHGEGTGLGLSVVHGIVKSHGGFLTVESEPGKGSLFSIYLPRIERHEAAAEEEHPARGGKECILFVDDEDMLVELNYERLTQLGYDVVNATRSAEALRIFKEEPRRFNLVITDYTMPDMTGVELAKKLLQIRDDIPIILCTGYNDNVSPEKAKRAGIREFLLKPQSKSELDRAIRRTLDAKTQQ